MQIALVEKDNERVVGAAFLKLCTANSGRGEGAIRPPSNQINKQLTLL